MKMKFMQMKVRFIQQDMIDAMKVAGASSMCKA